MNNKNSSTQIQTPIQGHPIQFSGKGLSPRNEMNKKAETGVERLQRFQVDQLKKFDHDELIDQSQKFADQYQVYNAREREISENQQQFGKDLCLKESQGRLSPKGLQNDNLTRQMNNQQKQDQKIPKLNAMTLFAFRDDDFTSVFSDCFANVSQCGNQEYNGSRGSIDYGNQWGQGIHQNSWLQYYQNDFKKTFYGGPLSTSSQTTHDDDQSDSKRVNQNRRQKDSLNSNTMARLGSIKLGNQQNNQSKRGEESPLNTSGSSLTEEIFNTALSNLEFLSDGDSLDEIGSDRKNSIIPERDLIEQSLKSIPILSELALEKQPSIIKPSTPFEKLSREDQEIINQSDFYCYDQAGCRMLQKRLDEDQDDIFKQALIQRLLPIFQDIMVDQFGNYLTQKILEVSSHEEIKQIISSILPSITEISMSIHGTRAVQFLIEIISKNLSVLDTEMMRIIEFLNQYIKDMSLSVHGNHVIQAFLCIFKSSMNPEDHDQEGSEIYQKYTQFIFDACIRDCIEIGSHKHGCCVMQRCLEKGREVQKLALADVIIQNLHSLIEDPYGNYLVQNVLKLNNLGRNDQIFQMIGSDFIRLSQLKFSSNVIEKCLESRMRNVTVDMILQGSFDQDDQTIVNELGVLQAKNKLARVNYIVDKLIFHQFGNYVLQKIITIAKSEQLRVMMLERIHQLSGELSRTKHGQKVITKLSKMYPQIFNSYNQGTNMIESNNFSQQKVQRKFSQQSQHTQQSNNYSQHNTAGNRHYYQKSSGNGDYMNNYMNQFNTSSGHNGGYNNYKY
ncbi:UNKNOWN [Stylonychia lemnae]|uniref:PUM-HD domain-containing protein n=1 Tax=Stylonychia lemnae TaxID=5949 RepID=A0A078AYZ1_STYLE|nr:UNKNOWN [Stylonychia lemnae]|eukprot:CDW87351.1 UNKNOWN [Stylonychia lemnae]